MVEAATTAGLVVIAQGALRLAEAAMAKRKQESDGAGKSHGERLAAIEAQLEAVDGRLSRIESKLDK